MKAWWSCDESYKQWMYSLAYKICKYDKVQIFHFNHNSQDGAWGSTTMFQAFVKFSNLIKIIIETCHLHFCRSNTASTTLAAVTITTNTAIHRCKTFTHKQYGDDDDVEKEVINNKYTRTITRAM